MKKVIILILCIFCLFGCDKKVEEEIPTLPEDVIDVYSSLNEINNIAETEIQIPSSINFLDAKYEIINGNISCYSAIYNGYTFKIFSSKIINEDISGKEEAEKNFIENENGYVFASGYDLYRFFYNNKQYVICLEENDNETIDNDDFNYISFLAESVIKNGDDVLVGKYTEKENGLSLKVIKEGNVYRIEMIIKNTKDEFIQYVMLGMLNEDKIEYECIYNNSLKYNEQGSVIENTNDVIKKSGYFKIENDLIKWNFKLDNKTKKYVFEKDV